MKQYFFKFMNAQAVEVPAGGFDPATQMVLGKVAELKTAQANLATKSEINELAVKAANDAVAPIDAKLITLDTQVQRLDEKMGTININTGAKQLIKTFGEVFNEAVKANFKDIANVRKGQGFKMELKEVGTMTLAASLTGDSVVNYGRNALIPAQRINFRDMLPTSNSGTLVQAYYREGAGEGTPTRQTEGSAKAQMDVDFTEVKTVTSYVSGFARYSKQLQKALPFMQSTLPRILLRRFYAAENA
jgi:hypothetical protein